MVDGDQESVLPLPVAGIMSNLSGDVVAAKYTELNTMVATMGSPLRAPYMTMSFMPLLVIPKLKIGDLGLFDGTIFDLTPLFVDGWI